MENDKLSDDIRKLKDEVNKFTNKNEQRLITTPIYDIKYSQTLQLLELCHDFVADLEYLNEP